MGDGPFSLAAVRCPRDRSEKLAELLISSELAPWKAKSKTLLRHCSSPEERDNRVKNFIETLDEYKIPWAVTVGWEKVSVDACTAGICNLAKKTITHAPGPYEGDSVLVPDGTTNTYGKEQERLCVQGSTFFGGGFQSRYGSVYISGLSKADLTYPEVMAADFIAGYAYRCLTNDRVREIDKLSGFIGWFDENWREPSTTPVPFYGIGPLTMDYGEREKSRVVSWIKGNRPDEVTFDGSNRYQNVVGYLESETVRSYLSAFEVSE